MTKNRFRINPKYQQGDIIRQNLRRENLRRSYGMNIPYGEALPGADNNAYSSSNTGIASDEFFLEIGEDGRIVSSSSSSEWPIFSSIGHMLFGDYEHAADRWKEASVADSWRLFQEKRLQAETTNRLNQVSEAEQKLQDLKDVEAYADLIDKKTALTNEYNKAVTSGDVESAMTIKTQLDDTIKQIAEFQDKVKTDGKRNDLYIDLFFDPNKATAKENLNATIENFGWDKNIKVQDDLSSPLTGIERGVSMVTNILTSVGQGIDKAIGAGLNLVGINNKLGDGKYTKRAIKQSLPQDRWTDALFVDHSTGDSSQPGTSQLRNKIEHYKKYWQQEREDRIAAAKESANKYKNGAWYFDPQKINPKFRQFSENNDSGILGGFLPDQIMYSFAEMGSSYSDWENMAGMMFTDAAMNYGANKLAMFALKRSPYVAALQTLADYNKLRSAGKVAEAAKLESRVAKAQKTISAFQSGAQGAKGAAWIGTQGANAYFINRMREHETNSEIIDAWSNRVLQNAMSKNADMSKVLDTTKQYLDAIGISTENMTDIDLVQHALAYNIPTGDVIFEKEKKAGIQGLQKVYNDNMSLAAKDYIEALPFLNFTGSYLRALGRGQANKFADETAKSVSRTLFDRTLDKAAIGGLNNIGRKLAAKHTIDFLSKRAKQLAWVGSLEGIEEGQQELLQSRYQRGVYDDYTQQQQLFSLPSIFEDAMLADEAVFAYLGLLDGDPDNANPQLRRAMQIGLTTGALIGGGGIQVLTNALPSTGKDNIRNLVGQIRNDAVIGRLVGDTYGKAQDDSHMSMFYDAFDKHGINNERLAQSLQDLKKFKGSNVSDEFIDRDIELMSNLWYQYKNPVLNQMLQDSGYTVGSKEHKNAVKLAARYLTQSKDASKFIEQDLYNLEQQKNTQWRKVLSSIDNQDGLAEANDIDSDILVSELYKDYQEYLKDHKNRKSPQYEELTRLQNKAVPQEWEIDRINELSRQDKEFMDKKPLSFVEFAEKKLDDLYSYRFLLNSELQLENLKNREQLLNEISKELGIDVSTSRLQSMITAIEQNTQHLRESLESSEVSVQNELIKQLNKTRKEGQPVIPLIQNIAQRNEKKYGVLPEQAELDKTQQRIILNRAVYDAISPLAEAFTRGKIDPRAAEKAVNPISWKSLSDAEKNSFLNSINKQREKDGKKPITMKGAILEFSKQQKQKSKSLSDLADQYKKHIHGKTELEETIDGDLDGETMMKDAAKVLLDYELSVHEELNRINHREYLRNEASPVETQQAASNGDEDAAVVLEEKLREEKPEESTTRNDSNDRPLDTSILNSDESTADNSSVDDMEIGYDTSLLSSDEVRPGDVGGTETSDEVRPGDIDEEDVNPAPKMSDMEKSLRKKLGMPVDDEERPIEAVSNSDESVQNTIDNSDEVDTQLPSNSDEVESSDAIEGLDENKVIYDFTKDGISTRYDDYLQTRDERTVQTSDQIYTDFLGQTFKFDPDAENVPTVRITRKDGTVEDIKFKNEGVLKPNNELGKKLLQPGWFEKADKYFVITADETAVQDIKNPDNLVVILIIQDGKDVYASFMEGLELKTNKGYVSDGNKRVFNKMDQMFWSSFVYDGETYIVKDQYGNIDHDALKLGKRIAFRHAYIIEHPEVNSSTVTPELAIQWYNKLNQDQKDKVDFVVRQFLSGGRPVHSNAHIREQIQNLRTTRNSIINACLNKDAEGNYILLSDPSQYKIVKPLNPRISDGAINEQKSDGEYIFRNMLDGGFGMSTDLEELTQQIYNEEVRLGMGRGERAFEGAQGKIDKLDPDASGDYKDSGYGHSGKIYFIAKTVNGNDKAISLSEKKFRPSIDKLTVDDIDEAFTVNGKLKEGKTPTIAEFILRLITDRISDDTFQGIPAKYIPAFKEDLLRTIVNCDKSTWVNRKDELKWQHFATKQFFYNEENNSLVIAIPDANGNMRHVHYSLNDIYTDETVRKTVISMIANNLHWNTPRVAMMEMIQPSILEGLREVFSRNPNLEEYSIAGIEDLTFKKSDLFTDDLEYKNVSLVAWMIGTGKLRTTVGDTLFRAPFIYADGPVVSEKSASNGSKDVESAIKTVNKSDNSVIKQDKKVGLESLSSRLNDYNAKRVGNLLFIKEKEARQKMLEGKDIVDFAILDIDAGTPESQIDNSKISDNLNEGIQRYIDYVNKEYNLNISNDDISGIPSEDEFLSVTMGNGLFTATLMPDNKVLITIDSLDSIEDMIVSDGIPVSGVYQTVKTNGTLDEKSAREWIKNTLGLSDAQIIVSNAILKGLENEDVYGVTNIAVDVLSNVVNGVFMFSKSAGRGTHYHEAFHYVNLLLHNKQQRAQIYAEYIKLHPEYKNLYKKNLEELLAEEFREYCERLDDEEFRINNYKGIKRWIAKLCKRFLEFVRSWGKRDLISKLFNDIRSANYSGQMLDQESILEFRKAYPNGVFDANFSASGVSNDQLDKLKAITTYQQFYSVAETVAHQFLDFTNIKKVNNISNINSKTFEQFLDKLRRDNIRKKNVYIQDVIDNPAAFTNVINSLLKQYGIVAKNKHSHGKKQEEDDASNENNRSNDDDGRMFGIADNYTIDQKTNVAFRAKLFLSQVKDSQIVYDKVLGRNITIQKKDPITGLPLYVSFDDAWQKITSDLHSVDSFEELMKTVERLAKTKAFFAELYKNLNSINGDTELQTQIYNTVNKHLVTVAQIEMKSKQKFKPRITDEDLTTYSDDEAASQRIYKEYDQDKQFDILNDNTLKARRMLPRDWSKDLFSSPVMTFDTYHHINKDYVKNVLQKQLQELKDLVKPNTQLSTDQKQQIFDQAFPKLLDLIQKMAIPFDEDVLTEYLLMHTESKTQDLRKSKTNDPGNIGIDQLYNALKDVIADPGASKDKSANISFFINVVFSSDTQSQVKLSKKKIGSLQIKGYSTPKKLDELYSSFGGEIEKMAIAYNNIHPSSRELSVTGPGGKLIYPVGENNFLSDVTRWINKNRDNIIGKLSSTPYAHNSRILDAARIMVRSNRIGDLEFKLNVFVGMEDADRKKGADYFGVNSLEDVISKMLFTNNNMIILPTMADKKTYYALELVSRKQGSQNIFTMPHDILISKQSEDLPNIKERRFSDATIETFIGYFLDELESLRQYYKKENIAAVVKNKNIRKKNFHGKVKNGRMDFSGNGGKFRYFYGLKYKGLYGEDIGDLNLNQLLEYEYKSQQMAEDPLYGDGTWKFRTDDTELDGFESVRRRIEFIRDYYFSNPENGKMANEVLYDDINDMLFDRVDNDMRMFAQNGENQLIDYSFYRDASDEANEGEWHYRNRAIPTQLISEYVDKFRKEGRDDIYFNPTTSYSVSNRGEDLVLSVVGNYVVQSMISTIEVEKIFSGDPAFYKWKYSKNTETKYTNGQMFEFSVLTDKDTDKIKRLGALLSPGSELRTDFTEEEYIKFPWLRGTKYTNATISDVNAVSIYIDELKNVFSRQMVADIFRKNGASNETIDGIYYSDEIYKKCFDSLDEDVKNNIKSSVEQQTKPYYDITVSDAQVLIRPDMYRKIRMSLGQWSVIPIKIKYKNYSGQILETYYSDNEAFEILENDPSWIVDPEKAAKVSRLQLFPLKMSYFKNDPKTLSSGNDLAYGVYNKMAIFPAFRYLMRSTTGKQIYDRMNRQEDPLDMVTFESAVKVGLGDDIYSPYNKKTSDISKLSDKLNYHSSIVLENDNEKYFDGNETLNVEVQDIRGLRMQLNTEAHTDDERSIGTQMFKIMFSNLYDNEDYVQNKEGRTPRKGKEIREDIMSCIKALTAIGAHEIKQKFWDSTFDKVDGEKVRKYLQRIAENNGLSESVVDILNNGATIESLMQRTLFEYSVSSLVNSSVIDINTKGGSAIQQSVFGFVSYGANQVRTEDERTEEGDLILNGGRELSWNEQDGSMEVMLSMNFFKSVVPKNYQHSYKEMRNWLVRNNIIKGFWVEQTEDGKKITHWSNPKPFGVGYRIPTQGLSSTFAFTVADVLPEQSGDLIIVPREFTAQTGSDFDVDKLYLATMSYKSGKLEEVDGELINSSKGAVANRLIQNYIDVVTDIKNRANARGSIDTVTDIIQNSTLPAIRGKYNRYRDSMYELTPYFQLRRKQEFSIGKSGIGPFALNITNLALTQYSHVTIDFSDLPFKMGSLDEIVGEDGIRISDWLSAMVNAHVDVAKDPYVFDLNINSLTYNFTNLLLRAGKGESTFLFLAQPALKRYAALYNNAGGLYGGNLRNSNEAIPRSKIFKMVLKEYETMWKNKIEAIQSDVNKKAWKKTFNKITKNTEDVNWNGVFDKDLAKKALKNPNSLIGLQFQVMALRVLDMLNPYAQELSDLVKMSRIDTKKFGSTLSLQRDFINEYNKFKYNSRSISWLNTDGSNENPLEKYFKSTFLDQKLNTAVGLTKEILESQMFTSSKMFGDMISTVFSEIFGYVEYNDNDHNNIKSYETVFDKKVVQAISDAAENVVRQKMLTFYGSPKTISDSYDYRKTEKENGYSGPIDFTFGGYQEELQKELRRIFFGDPSAEDQYDRNSIFTNIATIIKILENSSEEDRLGKFAGLVNQDGRVSNELLNYLRPQPANERFKIPTILLKKTNRNTAVGEKNKLISSFDFLLKNNNPTIRRLARDIAIYAYYSTYNTNKHNTFFDLVPREYRKQYDDALAKGIQDQNNIGSLVMLNDQDETFDYNIECKNIIDTICKNFYDDDNIVPIFEPKKDSKKTFMDSGYGEYIGYSIRSIEAKENIPTNFLTSKTNKPYLKIHIGGEYFLYQKVGFVYQEQDGKDNGKAHWYAYMLTPKMGIHHGSFDQYELANANTSESIFEDNKLPERFDKGRVSQDFVNFMKISQDRIDKQWKKDKKEGPTPVVKWQRYENLTVEQQKTIDDYINIDKDIYKFNNFINSSNPVEYINENVDVVFDLSQPIEDQIDVIEQNNQYSAEKDGISIGFINNTDKSISDTINQIFVKLQAINANISDMYVEDNDFGKSLLDEYQKSSYSFADNISIVSERKELIEDVQNEDVSNLSSDEQQQLEGAKQIDKVLDREVEVNEPEFISKEEVSESVFRGVTPEMIAELQRRKALQQNALNRESTQSKDHENC